LEGNVSSKSLPKGGTRFHLKSGQKINLSALSKTVALFNIGFIGIDIAGMATQSPSSMWAWKWRINPDGDTENRAYGLVNFNKPLTPYIFEFTKLSKTSMEVRFYHDFYFDHDYGFWRGIGQYDKATYYLKNGNWIRSGQGLIL